MDITCDSRLFICILLLLFVSKITSDPLRIHRRPSKGSLEFSPDVNANPWNQRLGKILIPFHRRKVRKSSVEEILPPLESSIAPPSDSELKILPPKLWQSLFNNLQVATTNTGCTCTDPNPLAATFGRVCSTTCLKPETWCKWQTCTRSTTLSILYSLFTGIQILGQETILLSYISTTQNVQIDELNCELLESKCIAKSASTQAKVIGALGTGAAIALSVAIAVDKKTKLNEEEEEEEEYEEAYQEPEYSKKLYRKSKSYFENLKSSMASIDERFDVMPLSLLGLSLRRIAQPAVGICSCSVSIPLRFQQECTTTCLSSKRLCGNNFCTRTSVFNAFLYPTGSNSELTTQTFLAVNNKDCEKLTADCIASSAIGAVAKIGAAAGLAAAALSSGMGAAAKLFITASNNKSNGTERLHSNYSRRTAKKLNYFDSLPKSNSLFDVIEPFLESSIVEEKNLKKIPQNNLFRRLSGRQEVKSVTGCTCNDPSPSAGTIGRACSTTCRNSETLCSGSRICYRTTTFMAVYSLFTGTRYFFYDTKYGTKSFSISTILTRTYSQIDEEKCELLESQCNAVDTLAKARQPAADVAALSVGLGAGAVGIAVIKAKHSQAVDNATYEEYGDYPDVQSPYAWRKGRQRMSSIKENNQNEISTNPQTRKSDQHLVLPQHLDFAPPSVVSSMEEILNVPTFLKLSGRQAAGCVCNILGPQGCTTTCLSSEQPCGGGYCTRTSVYEASKYLMGPGTLDSGTYSILSVNNKDCEKLLVDCSVASSTILAAGRIAAIGVGVGGGLAAGIAVAAVVVANNNQQNNNDNNNDNNNNNNNQQSAQISNQTPANNLPIPVVGLSFPDDGTGDSAIRFPDGSSHPIFSRGPCNQTNQWVTVDPISLQGGCTLRLCEEERVFVGRTGLCHDVNDPLECQEGRRLYYTAYGDPLCDCPIGQYPFPDSTKDDCVSLFSRGPCPNRQVLVITEDGRLSCESLECQSINGGDDGRFQQLVPDEKGTCFALGSRGPCSSTQLLGYDIFKRQLQCVVDPFSPESSPSQQNELVDGAENKELFSQDYISERIEWIEYLISISLLQRRYLMEPIERQDNAGILQLPSSLPDSLLLPCRTGARSDNNFKCANPLVSDSGSGGSLSPVPPLVTCPADSFLTASGSCVDDSRAASCGPSTRFNEATGQCRSLF
ncbi:hypothetical protein DAPPUDRAFT_110008 [Daphnia pulex]|uniref:DUF4789 domain-containing protein n=1 Tax=Daphnia pulex TaxID=6669 RepID=E9H4W9_DAPPU|nr:hypothetical protein DAPPUDRAFT_110008 [Daphnia pulex]|eukprot:EFX73214.1 hypothetical protein DAPPUDRAFT_110008 [Daphnia pulex]